jgi:hypothetical protein
VSATLRKSEGGGSVRSLAAPAEVSGKKVSDILVSELVTAEKNKILCAARAFGPADRVCQGRGAERDDTHETLTGEALRREESSR